jgi:hypothetical protein
MLPFTFICENTDLIKYLFPIGMQLDSKAEESIRNKLILVI